jgi:hypothetical protein
VVHASSKTYVWDTNHTVPNTDRDVPLRLTRQGILVEALDGMVVWSMPPFGVRVVAL